MTRRKPITIAITITASSDVVDYDYDYIDYEKADYDYDYDYSLFRSCRLRLWLQQWITSWLHLRLRLQTSAQLLMAIIITTQKRGEELQCRSEVGPFWAIVSVTRRKHNKIDRNWHFWSHFLKFKGIVMLLGIYTLVTQLNFNWYYSKNTGHRILLHYNYSDCGKADYDYSLYGGNRLQLRLQRSWESWLRLRLQRPWKESIMITITWIMRKLIIPVIAIDSLHRDCNRNRNQLFHGQCNLIVIVFDVQCFTVILIASQLSYQHMPSNTNLPQHLRNWASITASFYQYCHIFHVLHRHNSPEWAYCTGALRPFFEL